MEAHFPTTAGDLARSFNAAVIGDLKAPIEKLGPVEQLAPGVLSYLSGGPHSEWLRKRSGGVVLTTDELVERTLPHTFLVVANPKEVFATLAKAQCTPPCPLGISTLATVHPSAEIAPDASIGAYAVISEGVKVGSGCQIGAYVYLGANVRLGDRCAIYPRVTVLDRVVIGNRVKIYPGAVIGSDGFGFELGRDGHKEVPQIGTVVIEDDVRIGALAAIDRATIGETRIGRGVKIDNLVHVAHNCLIGDHCILCGQVGLSGSVVLKDRVVLGGQVGISDHVTIGENARVGAKSGVTVNLKGNDSYFGYPVVRAEHAFRMIRALRRLPRILSRNGLSSSGD